MEKSLKFAKIVRIFTIAPIMALCMMTAVFIARPEVFGGGLNYAMSILFIVIMPVLAYPLQKAVPYYKDKGREGQRNFAIVMAVVGYVLSVVYAALLKVPKGVWIIYLCYFFSGIGIALVNKLTSIRASGHACGFVGPIGLLVYFLGPICLIASALIMLVYWASLKTKRHTMSQLIVGSFIPIIALVLAVLVAGIIV